MADFLVQVFRDVCNFFLCLSLADAGLLALLEHCRLLTLAFAIFFLNGRRDIVFGFLVPVSHAKLLLCARLETVVLRILGVLLNVDCPS